MWIIPTLIYILLTEIVFSLLYPILLIRFLHKPGAERLGIGLRGLRADILVHAASVGEVNAIKPLLASLLENSPSLRIVLTTNTVTGRKTASKFHKQIQVILSPLDVLHLRIMQLVQIQPRVVLVAETEIWPMLLLACKLQRKKVIFVNARIKTKTLKRYLKLNYILSQITSSIYRVLAQSETDCNSFSQLFGAKCEVAGNLKYCLNGPNYNFEKTREHWGFLKDDFIIVWGSSRPGEEKLIINCYKDIKELYPKVKLIIAPRHLDRVNEVAGIANGLSFALLSKFRDNADVLILDQMGLLLQAYSICQIAIIGGSFYPYGGHNPLEAAYYGKIIIMGPHHSSCIDSVSKLSAQKAILLSDEDLLERQLIDIISNFNAFQPMGDRAREVLIENNQALEKHIAVINQLIK